MRAVGTSDVEALAKSNSKVKTVSKNIFKNTCFSKIEE
jgi:hypothetical protein